MIEEPNSNPHCSSMLGCSKSIIILLYDCVLASFGFFHLKSCVLFAFNKCNNFIIRSLTKKKIKKKTKKNIKAKTKTKNKKQKTKTKQNKI